jgi:hypothetical protein
MKTARIATIALVALAAVGFVGCELTTKPSDMSPARTASNIVINELFILPAPNPFAYQWIEFYNPTGSRIRMSNWTLGYRTKRVFIATDTTGLIVKAFAQDTVPTYYDVPFQSRSTIRIGTSVIQSSSSLSVPANNFMTIVSNEDRMKNYTGWGSEGGVRINLAGREFNGQPMIGNESFLFFRADTTQIDSVISVFYLFGFQNSDQIILKDSSGRAVDVMRYGNYTFTGPGTDPYPMNSSIGAIVPYQSFARFAGAYTSGGGGDASQGNTAQDFYITGVGVPNTVPIPHWLSQAHKQ